MEVMSVPVVEGGLYLLPTLIGVFAAVIAFVIAFIIECRWLGGVVGVLAAVLLIGVAPWVATNIDAPREQAEIAAARDVLQPYQDRLSGTVFPLKELVQKDLLRGEVQGSVGGGFFLVAGGMGGSVYGRVDEDQQLILVYYDDDTLIDATRGVWRVQTLPLESAAIVDIPAGEKPYLKYASEIQIVGTGAGRRMVLIASMFPTLYLPEGWQLIGANENYGNYGR